MIQDGQGFRNRLGFCVSSLICQSSAQPPQPPHQDWPPYLFIELSLWAGFWLVGLGIHADVEQLMSSACGGHCPQPQQELQPPPHGLPQRGALL